MDRGEVDECVRLLDKDARPCDDPLEKSRGPSTVSDFASTPSGSNVGNRSKSNGRNVSISEFLIRWRGILLSLAAALIYSTKSIVIRVDEEFDFISISFVAVIVQGSVMATICLAKRSANFEIPY